MHKALRNLRDLLLPVLCALALLTSLYALLGHRQAAQQLQHVEMTAPDVNESGRQNAVDVHLLGEYAVILSRWLANGSGTGDIAPKAQLLASFVAELEGDAARLDTNFWQSYSRNLSELEQHVRDNQINTPEARGLILKMRREYALLREAWHAAESGTADSALADAASIQQSGTNSGAQTDASFFKQLPTWLMASIVFSALATLLSIFGFISRLRENIASQHAEHSDQQQLARYGVSSVSPDNSDQLAILKLLDEMTPLASGDLTVTATVSEAMTGALADAFNYSVLELRRLVREISSSTEQINEAIGNSRSVAKKIASAGSVQSREVLRASNYLTAMSDAMAQLSAHSKQSSAMAESTVEQTRAARNSAQESQRALKSIKAQANTTARSMQRLVKSTELIQSRVEEIKQVAERTDLLALNTTIHAAAGSGSSSTDHYARLSDEVSTLADILGGASRDIVHCVETIRADANETLNCMQQTQKELHVGNTKVEEVGGALSSIDQFCQNLQTQVVDIADKALIQTGVVKQLSTNMSVINELTRDTSVGLHDSAEQVDALHQLSMRLRRSVEGFSLPKKTGKQVRPKDHTHGSHQ